MAENEEKKTTEGFVGYEDARQDQDAESPDPAAEKAVDAATNRLNPDDNTSDRG